jgi:hypothetical protein
MTEKTTTIRKELLDPTTVAKDPYTIGDTTFYESVTTSGEIIYTSEVSKQIGTPFNIGLQKNMAAPGSPEAKKGTDVAFGLVSVIPGLNILSLPMQGFDYIESGAKAIMPPEMFGTVKSISGFVPLTSQWREDLYTTTYEDPSRSMVSAAFPVVLGGVGILGRSVGVGEGILAPATRMGGFYQSASTLASGAMVGMYATDVSKRVLGSTPAELFQFGESGSLKNLEKNFPGIEQSRKNLNVVTTQELVPMTLSFAAVSAIGAPISGYFRTRNTPEIMNPKASRYLADEGFPTNQNIKTPDLIDSFNTGTITLKNPAKLSETVMAPTGRPITRIPTGSQIGAPEGQRFIYSGAEQPFLRAGFVGEGASELPAMYTSPQGIGYFTKAGQSQAGGFGMTNDIFGIYQTPLIYRASVESGRYQEIPKSILNKPYPIQDITPGERWSVNDPNNPRNIEIAEWIRTSAEPGIPIISQYGKSEWQFLIPAGSEVGTQSMSGFYRDARTRIPQYDVTFTGKKSPLYTAPEPLVNPMTGQPMRVVGSASMGISSPGSSGLSQRNVPLAPGGMFSDYPSESFVSMTTPNIFTSVSVSSKASSPSVMSSPKILTSPGVSYKQSSAKAPQISSPFSSAKSSKISDPSTRMSQSSRESSKSTPSSKITSRGSSISDPRITTTPFDSSRSGSSSSSTGSSSFGGSSRYDYRTDTTPTITRIPFGGGGIGGSSGGYPSSPMWMDRWANRNPVADIPYLSKGMSDPFSSRKSKRRKKFRFF